MQNTTSDLMLLLEFSRVLLLFEALIVDQAVALILLGEPFNRIVLVLVNALLEESRDPNVKRTGTAGKNVNPEFVVEAVAHAAQSSLNSLGVTPLIATLV